MNIDVSLLFAICLTISIASGSAAQDVNPELFQNLEEPLHFESDQDFEPFNPDAPKMQLQRRQNQTIRYFDFDEGRPRNKNVFGASSTGQNGLEIYVFDIGQADSMLVVGPPPENSTMLIDLGKAKGNPDFGKRFSAQHVSQRILDITGSTHIDYFVLSHFHSDHFGSGNSGLIAVMEHSSEDFTIGTMIDTGEIGSAFIKKRKGGAKLLIERAEEWTKSGKLGSRQTPQFGVSQINLGGGVEVEIMSFGGITGATGISVHSEYEKANPNHYLANKTSENDLSIAIEISLGDFEFWTAGDLSGASGNGKSSLSGYSDGYTNVEYPLVNHWKKIGRESDVEIYRASHHGSRYSSTPQLLEALDPEFVLYSAETGHGHPSPELVRRIKETARQFTTGLDTKKWKNPNDFRSFKGAIADEIQIFVSKDGSRYTIEGEPHLSFSDDQEADGDDVGEEGR